MTVYVDMAPELLLWSVDLAGWDEFEIAKKEPRLHEWVGGQKQPTLRQLKKFSKATNTPFGLLFLPEPPEEEIPIPDMRTIGNVAVGRPSADLLDTIHKGLGVMVMINGIVGSNINRKLDPGEFRGFALADPLAPLIFVNGADTKSAQIFTLIHELAHLWLGHSALSDTQLANREVPDEELWCNRVSAEVLVPVVEFKAAYRGEPTVVELERLAHEFKVSTLVILRRIYDAGLLSWNGYNERYLEERKRVLELHAGNDSTGGGELLQFTGAASRATIWDGSRL